ncbi:MAG: DUF502 domain-containing protein [Lactobacillales bacterium]|jgi:uncharacterized membrane protein|nr:DUF502 domain-containing protein [Lactobacillales bacterium]
MPRKKKSHPLKTYLITGVLVTAPLGITLYLAIELIRYIDSSVAGLIPTEYSPEKYLPYSIPGLGIVLLLVFLILVGMFTTNFMGKTLMGWWQRIVDRMPVISGLYNALRKIFETILRTGKETAYKKAVLIEYPRKGLWTIAFVTGPVYAGIQKHVSDKLISIYVPTTPNPTSGFLIYLPKKDVIDLDICVEDAFKMVISTGIVNPSPKSKSKKMISLKKLPQKK